MAAVTSSIMLMSQNTNNHFDIFNIIIGENFLTHSSNMFWPVTIFKKLSISILVKFDRYFNGQFLVKSTKYAYIRVQRVKISQNRYFDFGFTLLSVLTVLTVIFDQSLMT